MNPGYSGRSELPDNLKSLMRNISVMVPDYHSIAENTLMSDGFERATELSKKFIYLYNLMRQQFSKMEHYDFGLRSMKSVLRNAGILRRKIENKEKDEQLILLEAIRTMNESKLTSPDKSLFDELLKDLFKEKALLEQDVNCTLQEHIKSAFDSRNYLPNEVLITKCLQM